MHEAIAVVASAGRRMSFDNDTHVALRDYASPKRGCVGGLLGWRFEENIGSWRSISVKRMLCCCAQPFDRQIGRFSARIDFLQHAAVRIMTAIGAGCKEDVTGSSRSVPEHRDMGDVVARVRKMAQAWDVSGWVSTDIRQESRC